MESIQSYKHSKKENKNVFKKKEKKGKYITISQAEILCIIQFHNYCNY